MRMDIKEIRLKNLTYVLEKHFDGVKARLARRMNIPPNNLSRYFADNPQHRRNIGDETARMIEDAIGKPKGWMDHPHNPEDEKLEVICEEIKDFSDREYAELLEQIRIIKKRIAGDF